jgi:hypothetical protein
MEPEVQDRVTFKKLDATLADFGAGKFDVMYSRDAIMHIADKTGLYTKVFEWLKPGGQVDKLFFLSPNKLGLWQAFLVCSI